MAGRPKKTAGGRRASRRRPAKEREGRPRGTDVGPPVGLLDMGQAIELLKTTRPTFYRWLRTGKIRGMKVGRQWRFERVEIDDDSMLLAKLEL